ncbi:MAG: hypothetical protein KJ847_00150, partial [Firmicutes bacterium]|nr:hypothetical protein [Bacillota bacterium]
VLTYLALEKKAVQYVPTAPDRDSFDVINHFDEEKNDSQIRNILVESARLGKGKIIPLERVDVEDFDGLIVIGGMGVYKNLTNFVDKRDDFTVYNDVDIVIKSFYEAKKPIGTMCAGVILIAKSISETCHDLTVGMVGRTFNDLFEQLGVNVIQIQANEAHTDHKNKIVNTPAFLGTHKLEEILEGLDAMVASMELLS